MRLPNTLAIGAILAGLMMAPAPVAAQSFSFSFGAPHHHHHYHDFYPRRFHHFDDYRPRYRPRARIRVDLGPFSITASGRLGHIARCEARFRSYDRHRDSYMGFDGHWHRCRL